MRRFNLKSKYRRRFGCKTLIRRRGFLLMEIHLLGQRNKLTKKFEYINLFVLQYFILVVMGLSKSSNV